MWRRLSVREIYRNVFLSHSCTIDRAPSVGKRSLKGTDSELFDKTGGRKSGVRVSSVCADWLIAVCHSNLCDTQSRVCAISVHATRRLQPIRARLASLNSAGGCFEKLSRVDYLLELKKKKSRNTVLSWFIKHQLY